MKQEHREATRLDPRSLNNIQIRVMKLRSEHALRAENTSTTPIIQILSFIHTFRRLAAMPINALRILAGTAISTASHARHHAQDLQFLGRRRFIVTMRAFLAVGTLVAQEMDVAHLESTHFVHGFLVVLEDGVNALAGTVARDRLFGQGECEDGLLDWRRGR